MTKMETRFVNAVVRQSGAIGKWYQKTFEVEVTVQGGDDQLTREMIAGIHAQGYELMGINSHSIKRQCV